MNNRIKYEKYHNIEDRVIKDQSKENIKIINEQVWKFLYSKYNGGPQIIRSKEGNNYDVFYYTLNVYIVLKHNNKVEQVQTYQGKCFKLYISRKRKIEDLYYMISTIVIQELRMKSYVRIWKLLDDYKLNDFLYYLSSRSSEINKQEQIDFPGNLLDSKYNFTKLIRIRH